MYHVGRGVPQNGVHALAWLSLAAAQGLEGAGKVKDAVRRTLASGQIVRAEDLSMRIWQQIQASK